MAWAAGRAAGGCGATLPSRIRLFELLLRLYQDTSPFPLEGAVATASRNRPVSPRRSIRRAQAFQLHHDVVQVGGGQVAGLSVGAFPPVPEPQESPDLVEGEPEIPRPTDER